MGALRNYKQIVNLPVSPLQDIRGPGKGNMLTRAANGSIAEIGQRYPDVFSVFSTALCMLDMDAAVQSLIAASKTSGLVVFKVLPMLMDNLWIRKISSRFLKLCKDLEIIC